LARAAALSWMTPFLAARSMALTVSFSAARAASASPACTSPRSFFTWVLSWETLRRLRARRFTSCLCCFIADACLLATLVLL
jgi:hypothetical protein